MSSVDHEDPLGWLVWVQLNHLLLSVPASPANLTTFFLTCLQLKYGNYQKIHESWGVFRLHGGFSFLFQAAKGDVLQPADPWLLRRAEGMKPRCCPVEIPQTRWWGFQYLGLWLNIPFLRTNALSKTPQKGRTNFSEESLHVFYAVSCKMWRCFIIHDWFLPYIYIYCIYVYINIDSLYIHTIHCPGVGVLPQVRLSLAAMLLGKMMSYSAGPSLGTMFFWQVFLKVFGWNMRVFQISPLLIWPIHPFIIIHGIYRLDRDS